jgi:hypothetical protein
VTFPEIIGPVWIAFMNMLAHLLLYGAGSFFLVCAGIYLLSLAKKNRGEK